MVRILLPLVALFYVLTTSLMAHAEMPNHLRFVEHNTSTLTTVDVLNTDAGYTVSLFAGNRTILLERSKCRAVAVGYHCYIKPVRVRGILVTDVLFTLSTNALFDIKKIVLINGSTTAIAEIGKNFTLEQ